MPLLHRRDDALTSTISAALARAETRIDSISEPKRKAELQVSLAVVLKKLGDEPKTVAAREKAAALARSIPDDDWAASGHAQFAASIAKAGDRALADRLFKALQARIERPENEILMLGELGELASALHSLSDDKAARTLTRKILQIAAAPGPQQDDVRFQLAVYALAEFGDPDGAEALLSKVKDPWDRWPTFREIANRRARTDKPRGIAALKRCMAIWLPSKEKSPGNTPALALAMVRLGQKAEAKALADRLPTLFPGKKNAVEVRKARAQIYGFLKLFPLAETQLAEIDDRQVRSAGLLDLLDTALREKDPVAFDRILARVAALLPKSDPQTTVYLSFFSGLRAVFLVDRGNLDAAVPILQKAFAALEKLPGAAGSAELAISLADSVLSARK